MKENLLRKTYKPEMVQFPKIQIGNIDGEVIVSANDLNVEELSKLLVNKPGSKERLEYLPFHDRAPGIPIMAQIDGKNYTYLDFKGLPGFVTYDKKGTFTIKQPGGTFRTVGGDDAYIGRMTESAAVNDHKMSQLLTENGINTHLSAAVIRLLKIEEDGVTYSWDSNKKHYVSETGTIKKYGENGDEACVVQLRLWQYPYRYQDGIKSAQERSVVYKAKMHWHAMSEVVKMVNFGQISEDLVSPDFIEKVVENMERSMTQQELNDVLTKKIDSDQGTISSRLLKQMIPDFHGTNIVFLNYLNILENDGDGLMYSKWKKDMDISFASTDPEAAEFFGLKNSSNEGRLLTDDEYNVWSLIKLGINIGTLHGMNLKHGYLHSGNIFPGGICDLDSVIPLSNDQKERDLQINMDTGKDPMTFDRYDPEEHRPNIHKTLSSLVSYFNDYEFTPDYNIENRGVFSNKLIYGIFIEAYNLARELYQENQNNKEMHIKVFKETFRKVFEPTTKEEMVAGKTYYIGDSLWKVKA